MRRSALTCVLLTALVCVRDARAANELCGQTITTSTTVDADQSCTGNGLIVGADGITIDLGGFTISGDGDAADAGIMLNDHSDVKIQHGTVRNFGTGILALGVTADAVKVSNVTARNNGGWGASLSVCSGSVTRSSFIGNGDGGLELGIGCDKPVSITSSAFVGNGALGGLSLSAFFKGKISGIVATTNEGRGVLIAGRNISFRSSTVAANGDGGVLLGPSAEDVTVANDVIVGNLHDGVTISLGEAPRPNVIAANLIAGNGDSGIHLMLDAEKVIISGNRLVGNGGDGVAVESPLGPNLVKGNTAIGNSGEGFSTINPATTFMHNVANANRDQGFLAAAGAIDGGGNTTRANGNGTPCSAAIACPPPFAPKAGPTTPTCEMHVTTSIKLGADSPFCTGTNGIIIDADGVTIDLNGHRLLGDRSADTAGVNVNAHKKVTIANGIIQGFATGISTLLLSDGLKISNVEVRDSMVLGVFVAGSGAVISKSVMVSNSGRGLVVSDFAAGTKVSSSFFVANTGDGLTSRAPGGALSNVTSTVNGGAGILLTASGNGKLQRATVAGNHEEGVRIAAAFGALAPSVVKKTLAIGNDTDGIALAANSVALTLDSNFTAGNGGNGLALTTMPQQTTIKKHLLVGNVSNGLFVDTSALKTAIIQNRAVGNGGDGLEVNASSSTLVKNTAVANLGSGIATPVGATDGGGNQARDNAGPQQCIAPIVCD